jgi:hypothetical protein
MDGIDKSSPRPSVEGADIVPDREARKDSISLALQEHSTAVGLDLDCANAGMPKKHSAEDSSPCSCK